MEISSLPPTGAPDAPRPLGAPRTLHGLERETLALEAALADPAVRIIVAGGPAGAGKTAFLKNALARCAREGALTGFGKHAEGEEGDDVAPLMAALEGAVEAGLNALYDPEAGLATLAAALGANAGLLGAVGTRSFWPPAQAPVASAPLAGEAAQERLNEAVFAALRWLGGFGQPVIVLIDDWGRASERIASLYERVVSEAGLGHVRLFATERSGTERPLHGPLKHCRIALPVLGDAARAAIAGDMLGADPHGVAELVNFLGAHAATPLDLISAIRLIHDGGGLTWQAGAWRLDHAAAASLLGDTSLGNSIAERLARQLLLAGGPRLTAAQTLAVFGDRADCDDLARACALEPTRIAPLLDALRRSGLITPVGSQICFSHDRMRAALLETMTAQERRARAAAIADALRQAGAAPSGDVRGLIMLRRRIEAGLEGADPALWRDLFLTGAQTARQTGARALAEAFGEVALTLAEASGGAGADVYLEAVLAGVERGEHDVAIARANKMAEVAVSANDKAKAAEMRVFAYRMAGDLAGAIEAAREGLALVGVRAPVRPTFAHVAFALLRVLRADPRKAERLGPLSADELARQAPIMRAINALGSLLFERDVKSAVTFVAGSLPFRVAAGTAAGAGGYAFMCAFVGAQRKAARWAQLSDRLQAPDQPLRAVGMQYATRFGHWATRSRLDLMARTDEMQRLAYAEGDLAAAAYANRDRVNDALFSEIPLSQVEDLAANAREIARRLRDDAATPAIDAARQMAVNLRYGGAQAWRLAGAYFAGDTETFAGGANVARVVAMYQALLSQAYGAHGATFALYERCNALFGDAPFSALTRTWTFATAPALLRTGRNPSALQIWLLRRACKLNPRDNDHRVLLIDAEIARRNRRTVRALQLYERAVDAGARCGCLLEAALTASRACEGARDLGAPEAGARFDAAAGAAWAALEAGGVLNARAGEAGHAMAPTHAGVAESGARAREAELAAARGAAERANAAKSRFMATVGHELRTPLQGLSGLLELAESHPEQTSLAAMRSAIGQLSTLVSDLTDLGALEGGVFTLAHAPFDPVEMTQSLVRAFAPQALARGRALDFDHTVGGETKAQQMLPDQIGQPAPSPLEFGAHEPHARGPDAHTPHARKHGADESGARAWAMGDEVRTRQIVSNLIANAMKHGKGGVRVSLVQEYEDSGRVRLTFQVRDEGPGLRPEDMARLFEPFRRGDDAAPDGGLGLGLSLARRLAEAMGGALTAEPGAALFQFVITCALDAEARAERTADLRGMRILLAEDTPLSRSVLAALLRAEGCVVFEAADGAAALVQLQTTPIDGALLDARMPRLGGLEVAAQMRATPSLSAIPIVIASAAPDPRIAVEAQRLRARFALKPLGRSDLRRALGRKPPGSKPPGQGPDASAPAAHLFSQQRHLDRMAELRAALGHEADVMIDQLWPALESLADAIAQAAHGEDRAQLALSAHRLAGLAAHFGLVELCDRALVVEDQARQGAPEAYGRGCDLADAARAATRTPHHG